jgi:Rrf2 family protein
MQICLPDYRSTNYRHRINMPFQARAEYGCLAMLELARNYAHGEIVQIRRIADEHNIPQPFLLQVMQQLKRSGLVVSTRGASGVYRIARDPIDITLAEVIDVFEFEGPPKTEGHPASLPRQVLHELYSKAENAKRNVLAATSLDDFVECTTSHSEPIWHI